MTAFDGDAGFDPARFMAFAGRIGHGAALGITYRAHGGDWAELVLPYTPALVGDAETRPNIGRIATGPIVGLMDMATSVAIWIVRGGFRPQATLDMRIDHVRPPVSGRDIVGRGECYRVAGDVAYVRGVAHDGDPADPVAHVTATFMSTGG